MGVLWLIAGVLMLRTPVMLALESRHAWVAGVAALILSQAVTLTAWSDAWAGTVANLVLLVVALGWFTDGPTSFQAKFDREAAAGVARRLRASLFMASSIFRRRP